MNNRSPFCCLEYMKKCAIETIKNCLVKFVFPTSFTSTRFASGLVSMRLAHDCEATGPLISLWFQSLSQHNENTILVSPSITAYALSQTELRKSGPFGAVEFDAGCL
jgi:hypothetical protein